MLGVQCNDSVFTDLLKNHNPILMTSKRNLVNNVTPLYTPFPLSLINQRLVKAFSLFCIGPLTSGSHNFTTASNTKILWFSNLSILSLCSSFFPELPNLLSSWQGRGQRQACQAKMGTLAWRWFGVEGNGEIFSLPSLYWSI